MSCATGGCKSGGCKSGGCNRLNVYDWLSDLPFSAQNDKFNIVEISFRNGKRKGFFINKNNIDCHTGDMVTVESAAGGFDVGKVSLSGELVRLQMRRKRVRDNAEMMRIMRLATEQDIERMQQSREVEYGTMLMARVIVKQLDLNMKISDVEYQADGRKATFYYTADDRVDFRELIRVYAREFKVKIEMRQIGSRQEAGLVGGLGSCGRELCCSTWLTDFKSVSTLAARYQNLSINQAKLSGQCGRLKCCLNYELDTYVDALKGLPTHAERLESEDGYGILTKTDIFKPLMWYSVDHKGGVVALTPAQVNEIWAMNKRGEKPISLKAYADTNIVDSKKKAGQDILGELAAIEPEKKKKKKKKKKTSADKNIVSTNNHSVGANPAPQETKEATTPKPIIKPKLNNNDKPTSPQANNPPTPTQKHHKNRPNKKTPNAHQKGDKKQPPSPPKKQDENPKPPIIDDEK